MADDAEGLLTGFFTAQEPADLLGGHVNPKVIIQPYPNHIHLWLCRRRLREFSFDGTVFSRFRTTTLRPKGGQELR